AIVLPSFFEEQAAQEELSQSLLYENDGYRKYIDYYLDVVRNKVTTEKYMDFIKEAKSKVDIPIIGSLNGISVGGWINNALEMEEAGADAIELNIYFLPTDPELDGRTVEESYLKLVDEVTKSIAIPVAVKIHPYLSSIPNMSKELVNAGASALVFFNRFYQPDINLEKMKVEPMLRLSTSDELLLRIRWAAIIFDKVKADIAITGGVHTAEDIIKSIMSGANVSMVASALLERGISYLRQLITGVKEWLENHEYESLQDIYGIMSHKTTPEPALLERANYLKVLDSYHQR
ncbi:MAG TPA: dihydroorotate dehydrogenase-like protein, partial [Atribacterota bacterium]|nr:dihydroorotate dehydrogenase-like protein [Atribacterota bacterium]